MAEEKLPKVPQATATQQRRSLLLFPKKIRMQRYNSNTITARVPTTSTTHGDHCTIQRHGNAHSSTTAASCTTPLLHTHVCRTLIFTTVPTSKSTVGDGGGPQAHFHATHCQRLQRDTHVDSAHATSHTILLHTGISSNAVAIREQSTTKRYLGAPFI